MREKTIHCVSVGARLALALLLAGSSFAAERLRPGVIAHRGVILDAPENTLSAIARAIELGCALVEIDLRYTSDGEVVIIHDATLERTTNGSGTVASLNLAQLRQLDAGAYFGKAFAGTKIPTLREAIELARGKIQLYLDLKETDPIPAARAVLKMDAHSVVVFRPYSFTALKRITHLDPKFRVLVDLEDWLQLPGILGILRREFPTASFSSGWRNWTEELLAEARRLKVETFVNVLGPDDTGENLRRAVEMGFDYIQTDYQQRLFDILRQRGASPARAKTPGR